MSTQGDPHPGSLLFPQRTGNDFHDLCTMVGMITLSWAWCETNLAAILLYTVYYAGPIEGFKRPPIVFSRQIDCLKAALKTKNALADLKAEGLQIAEIAEGLSKRRNRFIHAAVTRNPGQSEFDATLVAVIDGQYRGEPLRFSVNDAAELNHHVAVLEQNMASFTARVLSTLEAASHPSRASSTIEGAGE